jgi:DNA-binding transcriptional MocR family regulator
MWIVPTDNAYIAAMTMWLPNLEGRKGPVYRAIADAIDADVEQGTLRAGARLPPHRDLADHLGVTVTTVTRAYTEAARRGLTSGHVGRGTFIRGREPEESDNGLVDLSINVLMPDKEVANLEVHLMRRRVLPWTQLLGYAPKRGHLRHRQAMAAWLTYLGMPADPDHIVLTAGAQHGLATTLCALVKPGETLLVEDLTYSGIRLLSQQMHFKLRGVSMDAEGLKPEALDAACRTSRASVLYCMPRLQNPTSAVMSEKRRRQIAAIAEKYRLTVIEDDTYGFLSPERWPLARLIPQRTVFVTSLSKSLFPGMRLGCAVAPPSILERITQAVWATMITTSSIGADLLSGWIEDGTAARIADWKRHEGAARQAIAKRLLAGQKYQTHPCSPHLWLTLPTRWSSEGFVAQARSRSVVLNSSSEFTVGSEQPRAVRLCLGTPRTRGSLEQALGRVNECLEDRTPTARAVV